MYFIPVESDLLYTWSDTNEEKRAREILEAISEINRELLRRREAL